MKKSIWLSCLLLSACSTVNVKPLVSAREYESTPHYREVTVFNDAKSVRRPYLAVARVQITLRGEMPEWKEALKARAQEVAADAVILETKIHPGEMHRISALAIVYQGAAPALLPGKQVTKRAPKIDSH